MTKRTKTRHTQIADERERIGNSNALAYFLDIVDGRPLPERDEGGRVVAYSDRPTLDQRIKVMQTLLRKTLPDLQAQSVEITGGEGGAPLQLVLAAGVVPPRSGGQIDVTPESDGIENTCSPMLDNMPTTARTRKKVQ